MLITLAAAMAIAPSKPAPRPVAIGSAIAHVKYKSGGKNYHMIKADMGSGMLEADTVYANSLTPAWGLIGRSQPLAAITGTFFAPQNGTPVADVLVGGELKAKGNRGTVLGVADDGSVVIRNKPFKREFDWSGYKSGLRGAVRLVENGIVRPNPKAQSFKDPAIWGRAARTGVGLTHNGKLVFVATSAQVTLSEFGHAMKKQGVVDAVSLDGGGSTCLYYRGQMVLPTSRKLTTMFVIKPSALALANKEEFYAEAGN